ncbi:adenosine deaminase [Corynebacterium mendelii]|uniref:adenosine deaminase n=1 Tax=Corynebacterium mendelii TaxID=2765362 RepID=A0A939DZH1_9CORY|nr:adenosine deaminase [Corynebacterium mendelii]MBN9644110.1 adenosine deaminase [Corynebacterium mendelii]
MDLFAPDVTPTTPADRAVVAALPKVVLHDHLDGGLRPATLVELAAECGYTGLPSTTPDLLAEKIARAADSGSLDDYLKCFAHTTAVMQTRAALARVAREAVEDLAADNVVYAELRFAPGLHTGGGLDCEQVVEAVAEGIRRGEDTAAAAGRSITARIIVCGMRQDTAGTARAAELVAQMMRGHRPGGPANGYVAGFDLAGPEEGFPPAGHSAALAGLADQLIPVTIHAGEAAGIDSVAGAVKAGALRLGHAVALDGDFTADDTGIVPGPVACWIRDRNIALEMCPSSNLHTGAVADIADHPLSLYDEMGFTVTVNTDNRLVSSTTMTDEMMVLVDSAGYGLENLAQLTVNAINAAFVPAPLKNTIRDRLIIPAWQEAIDRAGTPPADSDPAGGTKPTATGGSTRLEPAGLKGIDPFLLEEMGITPRDLGWETQSDPGPGQRPDPA